MLPNFIALQHIYLEMNPTTSVEIIFQAIVTGITVTILRHVTGITAQY